MKNLEKEIFEIAESINEGEYEKLHIINNSDYEERQEYRIYHSDGYCWDVSKELQFDEKDKEIEPYYDFMEEWEGFKRSGIEFAIDELKKILNVSPSANTLN